jgi:hypothetical protein
MKPYRCFFPSFTHTNLNFTIPALVDFNVHPSKRATPCTPAYPTSPPYPPPPPP